MNNTYIETNLKELHRLKTIVKKLSDDDMKKTLLNSRWTVSGILAHLSFWDRRAYLVIKKWKECGEPSSAIDVDMVNDSSRELFMLIPPNLIKDYVIYAAEQISSEIADLNESQVSAAENELKTVWLMRANHWRIHLDQIEKVL